MYAFIPVETRKPSSFQFVMVTEPILCSLSDWVTHFSSVPIVPESVKDVQLSELEIKHGLLQVQRPVPSLLPQCT